jgi:hypothetical protein
VAATVRVDPAPRLLGVYVTWQLVVAPVPESEQLDGLKLPAPAPSDQVTFPPGAIGLSALVVSVTVAVQVVAVSTATGSGAQLTAALVVRLTVSVKAPLLVPCGEKTVGL